MVFDCVRFGGFLSLWHEAQSDVGLVAVNGLDFLVWLGVLLAFVAGEARRGVWDSGFVVGNGPQPWPWPLMLTSHDCWLAQGTAVPVARSEGRAKRRQLAKRSDVMVSRVSDDRHDAATHSYLYDSAAAPVLLP